MNSFIIITFLLVIVGQIYCGEYTQLEGRTYYVSYPEKRNWYQSQQYCAYNSMYLVDVRNDLENYRILSVIQKIQTLYNVTGNYWTSGTDLGSEGQFYWATTGHAFIFYDWQQNQPDSDASREDCVGYRGAQNYKWNDVDCEQEQYFICRDRFDVPEYKDRDCSSSSHSRGEYSY